MSNSKFVRVIEHRGFVGGYRNEYAVSTSSELGYASKNGNAEIDADTRAFFEYSLIPASESGDYITVKETLKLVSNVHTNDDEALRRASEKGHFEVVKLLLAYGANVHANDDEALIKASENGRFKVVKLLLKNGADLHAKNGLALQLASANGYGNIVKLLNKSSILYFYI